MYEKSQLRILPTSSPSTFLAGRNCVAVVYQDLNVRLQRKTPQKTQPKNIHQRNRLNALNKVQSPLDVQTHIHLM